MSNPSARRKIWVILKAAIWGVITFAGLSIAVIIIAHFIGENLLLLVDIPTAWLNYFMGWDRLSANNLVNSGQFAVIINSVLGGVIFMVVTGIGQFIVKNNHEN